MNFQKYTSCSFPRKFIFQFSIIFTIFWFVFAITELVLCWKQFNSWRSSKFFKFKLWVQKRILENTNNVLSNIVKQSMKTLNHNDSRRQLVFCCWYYYIMYYLPLFYWVKIYWKCKWLTNAYKKRTFDLFNIENFRSKRFFNFYFNLVLLCK